jgi:hypothetical protein
MMNLIKNASPTYKGNAQPTKNGSGGLLSQLLCYLFGGGTPSYKGQDQTAPKACGSGFFPDSPVYRAPTVDVTTADSACELDDSEYDESEMDDELNDSDKEPIDAVNKITIVVG